MHQWTKDQGMQEVEAILASAGNADTLTQVAKALVRAIYMTEAKHRVAVLEKVVKEFDHDNLRAEREYDFPEPWAKTRWAEKVAGWHKRVMETLDDIGSRCDTAKEVAELILKYLDAMDGDNQIFFLVYAIYRSGLCPYNFVSPGIEIDDIERLEITRRENVAEVLTKLDELFAGTIRTRSAEEEGAFLYEMLMKLSHKEAIVVLGKYAKGARGKSKTEIIVGIMLGGSAQEITHIPGCRCPECRMQRMHPC